MNCNCTKTILIYKGVFTSNYRGHSFFFEGRREECSNCGAILTFSRDLFSKLQPIFEEEWREVGDEKWKNKFPTPIRYMEKITAEVINKAIPVEKR